MRELRQALLLFLGILVISFAVGCSRQGAGVKPSTDLVTGASHSRYGSFGTESEMIESLKERGFSGLTLHWFDSSHKLLAESPGLLAKVSDSGMSVEITGELASEGSFLAVRFDPANTAFSSADSFPPDALGLTLHPEPGILLWGAAPVNGKDVELSVTVHFVKGADIVDRIVSKVPVESENSVDDIAVVDAGGTFEITWTEKNLGDYSNSGEVSIADVADVARNYLVSVNPADPEDIAAIADGTGDGEITIADVSPIASHYLSEVSGYRVYRYTLEGGAWETIADVERPSPEFFWRLPVYTHSDADTGSPDTFYAVRPFDSEGNFGISSVVEGIPGANPGLTPDPPADEPPPPNEVNLTVSGVKDFTIAPGSSEVFQVVLPGSDTNYVVALMNYGDASTQASRITIEEDLGAVSSLYASTAPIEFAPVIMETEQGALTRALYENSERVLREGRRPDVTRTPSTVGDHQNFNIVFADLNLETLDAVVDGVVKAENDAVRVWVDMQVNDGRITDEQYDEIAADIRDVILTQESETFGGIYDVDTDGKLDILFTPWVNAIPGKVLGLFLSGDVQDVPFSNLRDLVYIEVPDASNDDPPAPITPGFFDPSFPVKLSEYGDNVHQIAAHEVQHLVNFSNRLRIRDNEQITPVVEDTWLNEALSHFTEDFVGFQGRANLTGIQHFLHHSYTVPLIALPEQDSPQVRGADYLLLRYIVEQHSSDVLSSLLLKDLPSEFINGIENVERATGENFESTVRGWLATLGFIGWDNTPAPEYRFQPTSTHPLTGGLTGVEFLRPLTDYRGLIQHLPRPLVNRFDGSPIVSDLLPTAPLFVLLNRQGGGVINLRITAGGSEQVIGVFARTSDFEQPFESEGGTANLELGRLIAGSIDDGADTDAFQVPISGPGRLYIRVVPGHPGVLMPHLEMVGQEPLSNQTLPGVDVGIYLSVLIFPPDFIGTATFIVSGQDGTTGSYLLSAEYYPD